MSRTEHDAARAAHEADRARCADTEGKLRSHARELEQRVSTHREAEARADRLASQAEYGQAVAETELDSTKRIANQLREELERAADHLRQYARRNEDLAASVARLEDAATDLQRRAADVDRRAQLLRDLAVALASEIQHGAVDLFMRDATPTVRLELDADRDPPLGAPAKRAVAEVARLFSDSRRSIVVVGPDSAGRMVAELLADEGFPRERVRVDAATGEPGGHVDLQLRRTDDARR